MPVSLKGGNLPQPLRRRETGYNDHRKDEQTLLTASFIVFHGIDDGQNFSCLYLVSTAKRGCSNPLLHEVVCST